MRKGLKHVAEARRRAKSISASVRMLAARLGDAGLTPPRGYRAQRRHPTIGVMLRYVRLRSRCCAREVPTHTTMRIAKMLDTDRRFIVGICMVQI